MNEHTRRRTSDAIGSVEESAPERLLAGCRSAIRSKLPALLEALFSKLNGALYDLADKSESRATYAAYLEAMRIFRRERQRIEDRFISGLESVSEHLTAVCADPGHVSAASPGSEDRSRPEHGELEEALAVGNLISKAENRYRRELANLRGPLANALGRESIDERLDPLGPRAICNAFEAALSPVDGVGLSLKLVVYKLFDKQVMDHLGDFYESCAACLASSGLASRPPERQWNQPRLDVTPRSDGNDPLPSDKCDPLAELGSVPRPPGQPPGTSVREDLRRLLVWYRPEWATGGVVVDTAELLAALSRLQGQHGSGVPDPDPRALWSLLTEEVRLYPHADGGRELMRADEDTVNLVVLLFERILRRNDLPDAIKALIARLQIPIAKVALSDKSFFEDPRHPARSLVNHLARSAIGWVDDGDRSPDGVYRRIEKAVTRILQDLDCDSAAFAELDADLGAAIDREREGARAFESRAIQEMEGRARHRSAVEKVRGAIAERIRTHAPVPAVIASLLYEGWQQVLLAAYLRGGVEGEEWQAALATVDLLLWSVQPKVEYGERGELLQRIPELLRTLRVSLAGVSCDQRHLAQWFRELQVLHIAALRGSRLSEAETGSSPEASRAEAELLRGSSVPLDVDGGGETPRACSQRLPLGSWMEILRGNAGTIRAKLAWRSPGNGLHMFVDRFGRKVLELSDGELASLFEQGAASILSDAEAPLVDQAIEDLLQSPKRG